MTWIVNKKYPTEVQQIFAKLRNLPANQGKIISKDSICTVKALKIDGHVFYIKYYRARGKGLRRYWGRSRCKAEWKNLLFCQKLRINTPNLVAYGESNWPFHFRYTGAVITESVSDAMDLREIIKRKPYLLASKEWKAKVLGIVADYVSRLHQRHFAHGDLKLRNILVTDDIRKPKVYFFDMPTGRICRGWFVLRRLKKDLAILNHSARKITSKTERLRFYLIYAIKPKLEKSDKSLIKSIIKLCKKRYERSRNKKSL